MNITLPKKITVKLSAWYLKKYSLLFWTAAALFFINPGHSHSQEGADLELVMSITNVTCGADGALGVELSENEGVTGQLFRLFLLPDTQTPFQSNSSGQFANLIEGDYIVRFSGELNGASIILEERVTLSSEYNGLIFSLLSQNLCAEDDGKLEVVIQTGEAATFELTGPINRPQQLSPIFENLIEGAYTVSVTDICGDKLSRNFQVVRPVLEIDPSLRIFETFLPSCNQITVGHGIRALNAELEFPLQVSFTVYDPNNVPQDVIAVAVMEEDMRENRFFVDLPFYHDQTYTYDLSITDNCGYIATALNNTINQKISISDDLKWGAGPCGQRRLSVKPRNLSPPFTITFHEFPAQFSPELFNPDYPGPFSADNVFFGDPTNPLPDGFYDLSVFDACGNEARISVDHVQSVGRPSANILKSCGIGLGSVELINFDYQLTEVVLNSAPAAYGVSTPIDLSANINVNDRRRFYLNNLPEGAYVFAVKTSCGTEHVSNVTIESTVITSNIVEVEENCGTFNLKLDHIDNLAANQNKRFGLQKYFPETDDWGHPETEVRYVEGEELTNTNAVMLSNQANNFNLKHTGDLRVVKSARVWKNGADILPGQSASTFCIETLHTFSFFGRAQLVTSNFYTCQDESYEVYIDADGYEPLSYRIVAKNGLPFTQDNGQNPLFSNLEGGRYRFQIQDRCGNITNTTLQLFGNNLPVITPENLCEGESGRLYLPEYDFINYEWYRDDDPTNIIGTESSLTFDPFNINIHSGRYSVKLTHEDPNSCLNETLEILIDPDNISALPGTGTTADVCEGQLINLFDYLEGPFNDYGEWEELSGNATLDRSIWSTEGLEAGEYLFRYKITGLCTGKDSTLVTLNLGERVASPTGSSIQEFCAGTSPTVADLSATGENITWFTSSMGGTPLNPSVALSNNTRYFAEQRINECRSFLRFATTVTIYEELQEVAVGNNETLFQLEIPEKLGAMPPSGGKGDYRYQWQYSLDNQLWENIPGAVAVDYQPDGLLETTYFRRTTEDVACGTAISEEVLITVQVAPIEATGESFGPIKGFEPNQLPVLENDLFKGTTATPQEVVPTILSVQDEGGNSVSLAHEWDADGNLVLQPNTPPGTYAIQYQICQKDIPGNCASATISVWVGALELEMVKTVDNERAIVGDILRFSISVTNKSPFVLDGFVLEDLLPTGFMLLSATPAPSNSGLTWELNGFVPESTQDFVVEVMAISDGTFINQVRGTVGDFDETVSSPPVIVRAKSVDLKIEKVSLVDNVQDGDSFEYIITVTNNGLDDATEVVITDVLSNSLRFETTDFQSSSPSISPVFRQSGAELQWEITAFPVGETLTITLEVIAIEEGLVANEVLITSSERDSNLIDNSSREEITVTPLFIPNVFKPDNDGKNDTFVIRAENKFERIELLVFNRWGDLVFESSDYQNDWRAEGLNPGTYYYQVKGKKTGIAEKQYKGWIQVIK
nr:DUF11 domain-containing protein [Cytophagales bacterium]